MDKHDCKYYLPLAFGFSELYALLIYINNNIFTKVNNTGNNWEFRGFIELEIIMIAAINM